MNGVHDMGGMDGFGNVEVEPNEPPFHEKWEGRVFAMQRSLGYAGAWHIDHGRFAQEALPPRTYLAASYYWRWALGMQKNLLGRGFVGQDEIDAGHALRPGKALPRKLTADVVPAHIDGAFDLQAIILADRLGFHDAFVGEHLADKVEPRNRIGSQGDGLSFNTA
jgi:nitrile hydratase